MCPGILRKRGQQARAVLVKCIASESVLAFSSTYYPHSIVSFWKSMLASSSETAKRRFIESYEVYMRAMVEEAGDRGKLSIRHSIEEYLELRRYTGAIKPSFDLLLLPLEIPDSLLLDPKVKELEIIAIDMIAVANVSIVSKIYICNIHMLSRTLSRSMSNKLEATFTTSSLC